MNESNKPINKSFVIWGILDAIYISWYCINNLLSKKIPYISDAISTLEIIETQGGANLIITIISWALQTSIIASCLLLLFQAKIAKIICTIQTPLRIFFVIPSFSPLLVIAKFANNFEFTLFIMLVLTEFLKIWSLWKKTPPSS